MPNDNTTPPPPSNQQTGLQLPGELVGLIPSEWVAHAEAVDDEPEPVPPTEHEEIDADLAELAQGKLFDAEGRPRRGPGGRHDYTFPDTVTLLANAVRWRSRRGDVQGKPTAHPAALVEGLEHLCMNRRNRKLSDNDLAVQAEWTEARAVGEGLLYKLDWHLPGKWWYLGGSRAASLRRQILAVLMFAYAKRWCGFTLSAAAAERIFGCSASSWWEAVKWLEVKGYLVRMRRYANGKVRPRDLSANWYGLGPELLKHAPAFLADFGEKDDADPIAVAAAADRHRKARRDRGRDRRVARSNTRRRYPGRPTVRPPGAPAPA